MRENGVQYTLVTPRGNLTLNPTNFTGVGYYVLNVQVAGGLRTAMVERPQSHGAFVDAPYRGGVQVGFDIFVVSSSAATRQTNEDTLLDRLWSLMGGTGTLQWTPQDASSGRQVTGVRLSSEPRITGVSGTHKTFSFELSSERATAEAQTETTSDSTALTAVGEGLSFDFTLPVTFAASGGGTTSFTNGGTADAYPTVRVYGPISTPTVTNTDTGEKLVFTGGPVEAGSYLDIDLFDRTVLMDGMTGANHWKWLDISESTWFKATPGSNTWRLSGSAFDSNTKLRVLHRDAWA